jgi:hypothetical protein
LSPARARKTKAIVQTNLGLHGRAARNDSAQIATSRASPRRLVDRDLIFMADIYSQNEIEEIATSPAQLALRTSSSRRTCRLDAEIRKSTAT